MIVQFWDFNALWLASITVGGIHLRACLWVSGASRSWHGSLPLVIPFTFGFTYWPNNQHCSCFPFDLTLSSQMTHPCVSDPPDQLCIDCPGAEWQKPLRVLLPCGASWLLPGSGHGGHCQEHGVELRVHAGIWGQLWRERSGCLPPDLQRSRLCVWLHWRESAVTTTRD